MSSGKVQAVIAQREYSIRKSHFGVRLFLETSPSSRRWLHFRILHSDSPYPLQARKSVENPQRVTALPFWTKLAPEILTNGVHTGSTNCLLRVLLTNGAFFHLALAPTLTHCSAILKESYVCFLDGKSIGSVWCI